MTITLIGLGMGDSGTMTLEAWSALQNAGAILGAQRLLDSIPPGISGERAALYKPEDILAWLKNNPHTGNVCAVFSGDVGFYSGAAKLPELLREAGHGVHCLPGISTAPYLCARLGIPWQNVHMASAHGKECDILAHVLNHEISFFLTGGELTPARICALLCEAGLPDALVSVGERLSYPEERLVTARADALLEEAFSPLCAVLVRRERPVFCHNARAAGIPDGEFIRGGVPMTKQEVRCVILAKMAVREDDSIWDIGAGTGSVAVEAALVTRRGRVWAVERTVEGCALIAQNREKFGVYNLTCVQGEAPEACEGLPAPDVAFLGGTGGRQKEILAAVLRKNPAARVVLSAVTLESISAGMRAMDELNFTDVEAVQVAVSRAEQAGESRLLRAQNPIFIISGRGNTP